MRIPLALVALVLVLAGAFEGRFHVAMRLRDGFATLADKDHELAQEEGSRSKALLAQIESGTTGERVGALLLGLGCVLTLVVAASTTRAGPATAAAACLVGLFATGIDLVYPSSRVPGIVTVMEPSAEWPYGAVRSEPDRYVAFVVMSEKTGQKAWTGLVGETEVGPEDMARSFGRKLAKEPRPLSVYYDVRCPQDTCEVFGGPVGRVAKAAHVELVEEKLCDPADFSAKRRLIKKEALGKYSEIAMFSSLARFAWALALGVLVWRADVRTRGQRGITFLAGGQLILALGQVVALPVLLYVGMLPEDRGFKNPFLRYGENAQLYEGVLFASAALLAFGALLSTVGELLSPEPPAAPPVKQLTSEQVAARHKERNVARRPHNPVRTTPPEPPVTVTPPVAIALEPAPPKAPEPSAAAPPVPPSDAHARTPGEGTGV